MGIDYGMGKTNIGRDGIRYGILPPSMAPGWLSGEAQPVYPEGELEFECPNCGCYICGAGHDECPKCHEEVGNARDMVMGEAEPSGWTYEQDGVRLQRGQDDSDWWVMDSPYRIRGSYCSPCAPGAIYIDGEGDDNWGFCIPPNWFDASVLASMTNTPVLIEPEPVPDNAPTFHETNWVLGPVTVDLRVTGNLPEYQLRLILRHLAVNPPAETRDEFSPLENALAQIIWDREVWGSLAHLETLEPVLQCVDDLAEATWYGVSADLGRDLASIDQVVQDGHLWARKTFGQHVLQDGVLQQVARLRIERAAAEVGND